MLKQVIISSSLHFRKKQLLHGVITLAIISIRRETVLSQITIRPVQSEKPLQRSSLCRRSHGSFQRYDYPHGLGTMSFIECCLLVFI